MFDDLTIVAVGTIFHYIIELIMRNMVSLTESFKDVYYVTRQVFLRGL